MVPARAPVLQRCNKAQGRQQRVQVREVSLASIVEVASA